MEESDRTVTSPQPEERYHEEYVRLLADEDAKLTLLQSAIGEGASRGWQLISAVKHPGDAMLLVMWDTSGSFSN